MRRGAAGMPDNSTPVDVPSPPSSNRSASASLYMISEPFVPKKASYRSSNAFDSTLLNVVVTPPGYSQIAYSWSHDSRPSLKRYTPPDASTAFGAAPRNQFAALS